MRPTFLRLLPLLALLAGAAVLLTWRLGAVYLWQDEAVTAVLGERLVAYGRPLAWDGRNVVTMDSFVAEDRTTIGERTGDAQAALRYLVARGDFKPDGTWINHPWGQFLAAGVSLSLLGHGTAAARLPFALAALATIALLYALVRRVFDDRGLALLSAALLAVNPYWILHARQCRYYALSSLGLTLTVAAFLRWRAGRRHGAAAFVAAAWLYFHADFGSFFPAVGVLGAVALATSWPQVRRPLATFALLGAAVAPFVWYFELAHRVRTPAFDAWTRFTWSVANVNQWLAAFPILYLAAWLLWRRRETMAAGPRTFLWVCLALIAVTIAWVPVVAPASFYRYFVQLTPLASVVTAWTILRGADALAARTRLRGARPVAVAAGVLLVCGTAVLSAPVTLAVAGELPALVRPENADVLREIFVERPDPNRLVIDALAPRLREGDEILVNYEDVPFMFYTRARVRGGIAAFRAEARDAPPPRFAVLRRSVPFVHWPVFEREMARYDWTPIQTGAPDVPFGNIPDPSHFPPDWEQPQIMVGERVE